MYCPRCDVLMEYWGTLAGVALYVCPRCGYRRSVRV